MALLIVSSQKGQTGKVQVTATSEGLTAGTTEITTRR